MGEHLAALMIGPPSSHQGTHFSPSAQSWVVQSHWTGSGPSGSWMNAPPVSLPVVVAPLLLDVLLLLVLPPPVLPPLELLLDPPLLDPPLLEVLLPAPVSPSDARGARWQLTASIATALHTATRQPNTVVGLCELPSVPLTSFIRHSPSLREPAHAHVVEVRVAERGNADLALCGRRTDLGDRGVTQRSAAGRTVAIGELHATPAREPGQALVHVLALRPIAACSSIMGITGETGPDRQAGLLVLAVLQQGVARGQADVLQRSTKPRA
jgi:hypothetical protein